jgi:hypothetical protein
MPIDDADRKRIVQAIRTYIARERISREEFARRTRLGKSTVDKLVVGIFSEKTILQIEAQAKISLLSAAVRRSRLPPRSSADILEMTPRTMSASTCSLGRPFTRTA